MSAGTLGRQWDGGSLSRQSLLPEKHNVFEASAVGDTCERVVLGLHHPMTVCFREAALRILKRSFLGRHYCRTRKVCAQMPPLFAHSFD